jgi:hypothetical protein
VTTILGSVLAKPALVAWANKLGLQGIDVGKFVDDKAEIGTLAHYFIMCHFKGISPDTSDYSWHQIDQAENSLLSFFEWEKSHTIKPILVEEPLVSDQHGYGGTIDFYGEVDGETTLIDFKTSNGLYREMFYQVAAYRSLLEGHRYQVSSTRILRIGRDEDEGFEEQRMGDLGREWEIFTHCLAIYQLQKK